MNKLLDKGSAVANGAERLEVQSKAEAQHAKDASTFVSEATAKAQKIMQFLMIGTGISLSDDCESIYNKEIIDLNPLQQE